MNKLKKYLRPKLKNIFESHFCKKVSFSTKVADKPIKTTKVSDEPIKKITAKIGTQKHLKQVREARQQMNFNNKGNILIIKKIKNYNSIQGFHHHRKLKNIKFKNNPRKTLN